MNDDVGGKKRARRVGWRKETILERDKSKTEDQETGDARIML